jgi:hypothetical protein
VRSGCEKKSNSIMEEKLRTPSTNYLRFKKSRDFFEEKVEYSTQDNEPLKAKCLLKYVENKENSFTNYSLHNLKQQMEVTFKFFDIIQI